MASSKEFATALKAAANELGVSGNELGELLACLSAMPLEAREFFPIDGDNEAIIAFMRAACRNKGNAALQGPGSTSTTVGAPSSAKEVIIEYDEPVGPTRKRFKSQEHLEKWLARANYEGLFPGEGGQLLDEWAELVSGESYKPFASNSLQSRISSLESNSRHLGMRREEEFGQALLKAAVDAEEVSLDDAKLLRDARQLRNPQGNAEVEVDAVAVVHKPDGNVAYLGSHKDYTDGTGAVKDAVASRHTFERPGAKDPAVICPPQLKAATAFKNAFMAEAIGIKAAGHVPQYCKQHGVMQLVRSHGSIVRFL